MGTAKVNNRLRILDLLRNNREMSVSEVSDEAGASKPTVKKALDFYVEAGLLTIAGKGSSGDEGGKRPVLYKLNPGFGYVISIHLGPGFINAALMNLNYGISDSVYFDVGMLTAEDFEDRVVEIVNGYVAQHTGGDGLLLSLVVGMPGIVDEDEGVSIFTPHFPDWPMRYPLKQNLESRLGMDLPIYIDNVNRLQALAEMKLGSAKGMGNFMILDAISEGLGAGIIVNGGIRHGSHSFSGEIGHIVLDPESSEKCICGGFGCFETMVSERRVRELVAEKIADYPESPLGGNPENSGFSSVFSAGRDGDPLAAEIMKDLAYWLASGLNNIIMINDPELIVIQGIFAEAGDEFLRSVRKQIREKVYLNLERDVEVIYSDFGPERGVLGCGVFGVMNFFRDQRLYTGDVLIW